MLAKPDIRAETAVSTALLARLITLGCHAIALLIPLWLNLRGREPFEYSKAALLQALVALLVAAALARSLLSGRSPWRQLADKPFVRPVLFLGAAQFAAAALAVDRQIGWWGSYERNQGLLTLFCYGLYFLILSAHLRTGEHVRRLIWTVVLGSLPLIILGLLQALGLDPLPFVSDARSPVGATLGRSNFLGAYLAMVIPLTCAILLLAKARRQRIALGALLLGQIAVLGLGLARGAWLALAAAAAVGALAWGWRRLSGWRRGAVVAGSGLALIGGPLIATWLGEGGSLAARLTIWRASLRLIGERPILGYGPDTFRLVFPRVYPPELVYYQGRGVQVDRAHNLVLDWLAAGGALGLLAWALLFATVIGLGWRALHREGTDRERRLILAASMAAILGNLAGNLVSFDVTATATLTWLLIAVVQASIAAPPPRGFPGLPALAERPALTRKVAILALLLGAWIVIGGLYGRILRADIYAGAAQPANGLAPAIAAAEHSVILWPREAAYHLSLSSLYLQQAQALPAEDAATALNWLGQAEAALIYARDLHPQDYRAWGALGELYGVGATRFGQPTLGQADLAYGRALELAPDSAILYAHWALVDFEAGALDRAAAKFRRASELDATYPLAFLRLGDICEAAGAQQNALAAYGEAARWDPSAIEAFLGLARTNRRLGRNQEARQAWARARDLDPDHPGVRELQFIVGRP